MPLFSIEPYNLTVINKDGPNRILVLYDGCTMPDNPDDCSALNAFYGPRYERVKNNIIHISGLIFAARTYDVNASKFIDDGNNELNEWLNSPAATKLIRSLMTSATMFCITTNDLVFYARSLVWTYNYKSNQITHQRLDLAAFGYDPTYELIIRLGGSFVFVMQFIPGQRCNRILIQSTSKHKWTGRCKLILQLPLNCTIEQAMPAGGILVILIRFDSGKRYWGRLISTGHHHRMLEIQSQYDYLLTYELFQRVDERFVPSTFRGFQRYIHTTIEQ